MQRFVRSDPLHRLFFALRPPPAEACRIGALRDGLAGELAIGSEVSDGRLHITLAIGEDFALFDPAMAAVMVRIGDALAGEPVPVALGRLVGSGSSIALRPDRPVPRLRAFQRALGERMRCLGLAREGWRFDPHMTLGYRQGTPFRQAVPPIEWEAREFVLIHSVAGRTIHRELGRWPLVRRQFLLPLGRPGRDQGPERAAPSVHCTDG